MAKTRYKVGGWVASEVLTAADLNGEFDALLSSPMNLISPATAALDMNGVELILDVDGDSSLTADTDDVLHLKLQAIDQFIFDGDVVSPVGGLTFRSAAEATNVGIIVQGTGTDVGLTVTRLGDGTLDLLPSGAGTTLLDLNAAELILDLDGDSSITVDSDDVLHLRLQAFDAFIFDGDVASPVLGLTFTSAAEAGVVGITVQGSGTDGTLTLTSKGAGVINLVPGSTGTIQLDGGVLAGKCFNATEAAWDPASVGGGEHATKTVTVTGAALGDFVLVSSSINISASLGCTLTGAVTSADTVTVQLHVENVGGAVDLTAMDLYVRVLSRT